MNRKFLWLVTAFLFACLHLAEAQQPKKVYRIGFLVNTGTPYQEAFRQRLRELGYVEGRSLIIETRYAHGKRDRLQTLAQELVALNVEIIVAGGPAVTAAAQTTKKIPIVAGSGVDLVGSGLVDSLAHPGSNVTGTTNIDIDLATKRLEILNESFPKISRVAVLMAGQSPIMMK